jgi:hypothetical protein
MVFPAHSTAIPLLPNSFMVFNPRVPHCVSEVREEWKGEEVNLCSWFLKTAVVGGHNNKKPLTDTQKRLSDRLESLVEKLRTIRRGKEVK